jgi:hypothetical protein
MRSWTPETIMVGVWFKRTAPPIQISKNVAAIATGNRKRAGLEKSSASEAPKRSVKKLSPYAPTNEAL